MLSRLRNIINNYKKYRKFTQKIPIDNRPSVLISIKVFNPNRRLNLISELFQYSGYDCFLDINFFSFKSLDSYAQEISLSSNMFKHRRGKSGYIFTITDRPSDFTTTKKITIKYNVFEKNDFQNGFFYPILFHPHLFHQYETKYKNDNRILEKERKIRIFFAGNINKKAYDKSETKKLFGLNTRWGLYSYLLEKIPQDQLFIPKNMEDFYEKKESDYCKDKIVIIKDFKIPLDQWFEILSESVYFLHFPGFITPYCHNQIESMSVGTIPITEFPKIFQPELINRKNAIVYKGKTALMNILKEILEGKISDQETKNMRYESQAYYKAYLSLESFKTKLEKYRNSDENEKVLYICADKNSCFPPILDVNKVRKLF